MGRKSCRYEAILRIFQESQWGVLKPMSPSEESYVSWEGDCLSDPVSLSHWLEQLVGCAAWIMVIDFRAQQLGPSVSNAPCNQRSERCVFMAATYGKGKI